MPRNSSGPASGWNRLALFAPWGLIGLFLISRFAGLGAKVLHHDESLFAFYGWQMAESGNYTHYELLHGPLQIQLLAGVFKLVQGLHLPGEGDFWARFPAVLAGVFLAAFFWAFRREWGRSGAIMGAALLLVSPAFLFYSRFCRNEALFCLGAVFFLWSLWSFFTRPGPGKWLAVFLSAALLVCLKENAWFLLFNAFFFAGLRLLWERGRKENAFRLLPFFRQNLGGAPFAALSGVLIAWLLLEAVYTNGFQWDAPFMGHYWRILQYWWGQHQEHRLYGDFHYYLPILWLYELPTMLLISVGLTRACFRNYRLALGLGALFTGGFLLGWIFKALLPLLHMSHPWHLGLALALGFGTLAASWMSMKSSPFRSGLILWAGFSFLQYSYAGEKVPWISLHILLPALLLAACQWASWWNQMGPAPKRWFSGVAVILMLWTGWQAAFLAYFHPHSPRELLVYNHTEPGIKEIAQILQEKNESDRESARFPLVQGEACWPLIWYLRDHSYFYMEPEESPPLDHISAVVCDKAYLRRFPELEDLFVLEPVPLRRAWLPEKLVLFPFSGKEKKADKLSGWKAWKSLGRYLLFREMWGRPDNTARPLEVLYSQERHEM